MKATKKRDKIIIQAIGNEDRFLKELISENLIETPSGYALSIDALEIRGRVGNDLIIDAIEED